jgi:hypothetical protein
MDKRQELEETRRLLQARLAQIEAELAEDQGAREPIPRSRSSRRPIRDVVLDCLLDLGLPAYSQQIAIYAKARFGRDIPSTHFGALSRDEERAARGSRPREVWLCHGLTFDRGEAIRRLWARSDWPLHERVVAPTTGRVLYLRMTARLAELASGDQWQAHDPEKLNYLTADNARDLGLRFRRGEFPFQTWRESALAQLTAIEAEDQETRMAAAERLARELPPISQLFGRPQAPVALPGGARAGTEM